MSEGRGTKSDPVHAIEGLKPSDGVFARLFDGELLIVNLSRGEYLRAWSRAVQLPPRT